MNKQKFIRNGFPFLIKVTKKNDQKRNVSNFDGKNMISIQDIFNIELNSNNPLKNNSLKNNPLKKHSLKKHSLKKHSLKKNINNK